jgi:hypothetical protein
MERLPIKFFSKRDEDNMRVEGGGNNELPSFVLKNEDLAQRANQLAFDFNSIIDTVILSQKNNVPAVIEAKLNPDALAKSHREKINSLFSGNGENNVIGLTDEKTVKVMINNQKTVSEIKKHLSQPQKYAYEISCIEKIKKFNPRVIQSKKPEDYKVKLLNFQDYSLNNALRIRFERYLNQNNIEYKKTKYSSDLEIFKMKNTSSTMLDSLLKSEIFDLTEEIIPMPKISLELDNFAMDTMLQVQNPNPYESYSIVGVLDTGIENNKYLSPWIVGKDSHYPESVITPSHGTKVASIITYGDALQGEEVVGNKHVKVFDATVFPDKNKETIDEDDLIENIQEIVRKNCRDIKIWNLSISITKEISPDKFSDFAIALDSLQDECNVLICKSAGNCTNFAIGKPIGRLHEGADSVRSLVVGSLANSYEIGDIAEKNNPSPFSRIGPGPAYIVKPDLVHFGGNASITPNGQIKETGNLTIGMGERTVYSSGTSFSTPRIAALAAELTHYIKEDFDPLLIKGLLIHSCNYPAEIKMPINERTKYTGFGKPSMVNQILYNSPNEVTLILRDTLVKGQFIDIKDFPMPDCLIKNGYFTGQIIATLVYDSVLEASQGFEYCQSNMNLKFGSYDEKKKRDTSKRSILNPVGKDGSQNVLLESFYSKRKQASNTDSDFALKERLLIKYGDKYYPVKKYAADLSEVTDTNREKYLTADKHWFLYLDGVYRNFSELKAINNNYELSQEFCLIITLRDPEGKADVYNGVTQKLDEYNFWHSNIKVDTNVVVSL